MTCKQLTPDLRPGYSIFKDGGRDRKMLVGGKLKEVRSVDGTKGVS